MSQPSFNKSQVSQLYIYDQAGQAPAGYTVAFLQDPAKTIFPDIITLDESWLDTKGIYLLLNQAPADEALFVANVRTVQRDPSMKSVRFLWLRNPNDNPAYWQTAILTVVPGASGGQAVGSFTSFLFRNYQLGIAAGAVIRPANTTEAYGQIAFILLRNDANDFSFSSGSGDPLYGFGDSMFLWFGGPAIGCLGATLTMAKSVDDGPQSELGRMDVGLKYFYNTPDWEPYLTAMHYPVFSTRQEAITVYPCLDPLNPDTPSRSNLGFLPLGGKPAAVLTTYLRTWVGDTVCLQPLGGGTPRLVFAPKPLNRDSSADAPYYLVPDGPFTICEGAGDSAAAVASVAAGRIMCGLSGAEYIGYLPPAEGAAAANVVHFVPGQNAYSPTFVPPPGKSGGGAGLLGNATTAWLAFQAVGTASMNYYSQPDESIFFDPGATPVTPDPNFLQYTELICKVLPAPGDDAARASLPMAPLAGVTGWGEAAVPLGFESTVLTPARRDRIQSSGTLPQAEAADGDTLATTCHGMLGTFRFPSPTEVSLLQVQLGQSDDGARRLVLAGAEGGPITGVLRTALQSNRLFLVIDNSEAFARHGTLPQAELDIAGTPFNIEPDQWEKNNTIIVYKYAPASIESLAGDLNAWAFPAEFSKVGETQARLMAIMAGIRERIQKGDTDYTRIYEAVTDPAWNGIIAFNAAVSLAALPGQLSGLAAGIDPARFRAHHLGINISPMVVEKNVLTMKDTALFALIDYQDASDFSDTNTAYDFKVRVLKILYDNAEIKNFAGRIELLVNQLFGIPVTLRESPEGPSSLVLNGYLQKEQAGDTFVFTSEGTRHFDGQSLVMGEVQVNNAQFITENPEAVPDAQGIKKVFTRFSLKGMLRFKALPDFDSFSFGDGEGFSGGLSFANLNIRMDYELDSHTNESFNRVFTFDAQNPVIDMSASKARPESLFSHFPLKFSRFVQGKPGSTPSGQGYMACATPVGESGLMYPWFGIEYELNLGTIGALASSVGFVATLLTAWSYGSGYPVFTGLKIPGVSPQSLSFTIEGVIGISIDDFRFTTDKTADGHTAYTLLFSNLGLRILGVKLPPSAYIDLVLFGNPDPGRRTASLGWYAAYNAK